MIPARLRFGEMYFINKDNGCWEWTGKINSNGYGQINLGKNNIVSASRFSWIYHFGEIEDNLYVLHKCDNRKCVNPDHLFLGTQKDNIQDCYNKNRMPSKFGIKHKKHKRTVLINNIARKLSFEDIKTIKNKLTDQEVNLSEIAREYDLSRQAIWLIKKGKLYNNI